MDIYITINKKHATAFALFASLLLCVLLVRGFGGSNPSVMGHSALELIVNSSSVVDDSLTGDDIDESTLVIGGSSLDGAVIIVTPGNETTIQNAIDNLSSLGGGTVYMREGTYTIAGPINMTSNIALVGEGSATILQATTNSIDIVTEQNAGLSENVRLKDFAIRAGSATGIDGVVLTNTAGLIEGLDISGMQGTSISVTNGALAPLQPYNMLVTRNKIFQASGGNAIVLSGATPTNDVQLSFTHNIIDTNVTNAINTNEAQIAFNTIKSITGTTGILASSSVIEGNRIITNSGVAITATGGNNVVSNNDIEAAGNQGILVNSAGRAVVDGNNIQAWSLNAGTHPAIQLLGLAGGAITGNVIDGGGLGGDGINVSNSNEVTINGNWIFSAVVAIYVSAANSAISGNYAEGPIWIESSDMAITGNTLDNGDINITGEARFAVTGNKIGGYLDATSSSVCALTGNIVDGTLFPGTCGSSNNI